MQFRTAFPVALLLGSMAGSALVATGGESPVRAGEPSGLITTGLLREATAATAAPEYDIPMVQNAAVEHFVEVFSGSQQHQMAKYLKQSGRYEGMIRAKLRARGMPEDLVYLTLIESGFNPNAKSRANAVGMWQFMAGTARGYGLRVDGWVDERRDPEKSTDAALRYLRDLHRQFGSWYLAAAAYNGGDGRVSRIMKSVLGREKGRGEGDFWRIRHRLPKETRDYVPSMLAAAMIGKAPEKYGLGNVERWLPLEAETVEVPAGTKLEVVAEAVGVAERDVARLNPHLVKKATPPGKKPYPVRIPAGRADQYAVHFERIQRESLAKAEAERTAAEARERTVRAAARASAARASKARSTASRSTASRRSTARTHQVRSGESLWTIARRHDTTVRAIQRANGLGSKSRIRPGQRLRIPS